MTKEEAKKLIKEEGLKQINWYGGQNLKENEVGIKYADNQWIVYTTDERASVVTGSITEFDNESEALDNFITRARIEKNF
jgi:hypothetical protein